MGHPTLPTPETIQVSPRGFKASLKSLIEILRQRQISAKLWAKLPGGSTWLEDLERYANSVTPAPDIYLLSRRSLPASDWYTPILLPQDRSLRGEYGLLALAPSGAVMVLGKRLPQPSPDAVTSITAQRAADAAAKSPQLEMCFTLQPAAIAQVLNQIQQVVRVSLKENPDHPQLPELLQSWDTQFALPSQTDPDFVDALVTQQWQQQEQLRRQARTYRRQAMTASSLSTQNEALLSTLQLKDDFLNTVGQELRTPLTSIKTALTLLESPNARGPQRERYLALINRECERQNILINGVLNLLQIEMSLATATATPASLFEIVPGVVSTYQPLAQEKGIQLAYTVPNTLPPISSPKNWVRQIVIQLLKNSIQYTEAGGEVWVTAEVKGDDWVTLTVKDTGTGIAAQDLPHIFKHFYRGRQSSPHEEGAGLGLTIVQQLLLYCGGHINVDSQPHEGSQFRVRLPVYHED